MIKVLLISFTLIIFSFSILAQDTLRIATWNTFMLPSYAKRTKQKKRAKLIGNYFSNGEKADIICFQEMFKKKCRKIITDSIKQFYPYHVKANKGRFLKTNSGLMIFSKYPIIASDFEEYSERCGIEKRATKGIQRVVIKTNNGDTLVVNNTHLQSSQHDLAKSVRLTQLNQIKKLNPQHDNIIYCGDFNIRKSDTNHYTEMKTQLLVTDDELASIEKCTGGCPENSWITRREKLKKKGETIDYIFKNSTSTIDVIDKHVFAPTKDGMAYSDHSLIIGKIIIK